LENGIQHGCSLKAELVTVYAHNECEEAWLEAANDEFDGIVYGNYCCDRPPNKKAKGAAGGAE